MIKYICDECQKEEPGVWYQISMMISKPPKWLMKVSTEGETHACSQECVDKIIAKENKPKLVGLS